MDDVRKPELALGELASSDASGRGRARLAVLSIRPPGTTELLCYNAFIALPR